MKKIFYAAVLTLSFNLCLLPKSYSQIDLGTKVGAVSTTVSNNSNFSDKNRYSYQAGLYLSFDAPILFGVQTEILYNRTRLENKVAAGDLKPGLKKMGYWSLPLLVQLKPVSFLKIGAGPQWNFHTNEDKYQLGKDANAFRNYMSFVANAQLKVGGGTQLYFRYNKGVQSFENFNDGRKGKINRIEFGIQQSFITK